MNDTTLQPPVQRVYDLNRLSEAGYETDIVLTADELAKLAAWADVSEVAGFTGRVSLRRDAAKRFIYKAELEADIVQPCAITLEPVSSRISLDFTRALQLVSQIRKAWDVGDEISLEAGDDGVPEEIDSSRFDLMGPLLEELLLAIDPYPRADGVELRVAEAPPQERENPFAVLKKLRPR